LIIFWFLEIYRPKKLSLEVLHFFWRNILEK
jgi:hypothetical protein